MLPRCGPAVHRLAFHRAVADMAAGGARHDAGALAVFLENGRLHALELRRIDDRDDGTAEAAARETRACCR